MAANYQARPLGEVVGEYVAVRAAFVAFLRGLDAAAWERRAPADWTLRSVRAVAYAMAGMSYTTWRASAGSTVARQPER